MKQNQFTSDEKKKYKGWPKSKRKLEKNGKKITLRKQRSGRKSFAYRLKKYDTIIVGQIQKKKIRFLYRVPLYKRE